MKKSLLSISFILVASTTPVLTSTAQTLTSVEPLRMRLIPVCVSADSDSDGDGWGYENGDSCLIENSIAQSQVIFDIPPDCTTDAVIVDDQGWGWENDQTCIEPGTFAQSVFGINVVENNAPGDSVDRYQPVESFRLTGENDQIDLTGDGALFTVTSNNDSSAGIYVRTNVPVSNQVSMDFIFSSNSMNANSGDSRINLEANLFNSIADGGDGTGDNGAGGDAEMSLRVRNRSDGTLDVLSCANVRNGDGTTTPFVAETENGDGDGCSELGWFPEFDTQHTVTIGVDPESQSILMGFDNDLRQFPSLVPINEPADGFAAIFVGARGNGTVVQARVTELDTGTFVDTGFDGLDVQIDDASNPENLAPDSMDNTSGALRVVGSWNVVYAGGCTEVFTFNADGTFDSIDLEEIQSGTYAVSSEQVENNRYTIDFSILTDNQLPACDGETGSSAGNVLNFFADIESSVISYFSSAESTDLIFQMTR